MSPLWTVLLYCHHSIMKKNSHAIKSLVQMSQAESQLIVCVSVVRQCICLVFFSLLEIFPCV